MGPAVFTSIERVDHKDLVIARLTVVDGDQGVADEQTAGIVDLAEDNRISWAIAARIGRRNMAHPVELAIRMSEELRAGAGRKERLAGRECPWLRCRPMPPAIV